MRTLLTKLRAWYQRRFRGFVAPPAQHGGRGTSWQEHKRHEIGFTCRCGQVLAFMSTDLVIREQDHREDCVFQYVESASAQALTRCDCPIVDARYVKICPTCHLGHWKDASPKIVFSRSHA